MTLYKSDCGSSTGREASSEPFSSLRLPAATDYHAAYHSDDLSNIKTASVGPGRHNVTSEFPRRNDIFSLGACGRSSSVPQVMLSKPAGNTRASVSCSVCSLPLRLPPGLWSEDSNPLATGGAQSQCNFLNLSESDSSLLAGPSSELVATESSRSSSPPSGSCTSVELSAIPREYSLSTLRFLGTLGRGGYGKVLLAESSGIGKHSSQVAVKVLTKRWMSADDAREVKTEVQILQALSRNHLPGSAFVQNMLTAFQTKEHVFMVLVRRLSRLV